MYKSAYEASIEQKIQYLEQSSSTWFEAHRHNTLSALLILYVKETQHGVLKNHYVSLLDDSMECLISVLPRVVNHLVVAIMRIQHVSQYRLRPALSLVVYWIIQACSHKYALPETSEMLDIIDGLMTNPVLSFCD